MSRKEWQARPPVARELMDETPKPYVVVHHGGIIQYCYDVKTCSAIVRKYQNMHLDERGFYDIGYSFVIGEDGNAYEGRGWDYVGAHAPGYNTQSIGICIIGDFSSKYFVNWLIKFHVKFNNEKWISDMLNMIELNRNLILITINDKKIYFYQIFTTSKISKFWVL